MRRMLLAVLLALAGLLVTATSAGCDNNFVTSSARSGLSSFLTGVVTGAINAGAN